LEVFAEKGFAAAKLLARAAAMMKGGRVPAIARMVIGRGISLTSPASGTTMSSRASSG
jgi:hypothetical protein